MQNKERQKMQEEESKRYITEIDELQRQLNVANAGTDAMRKLLYEAVNLLDRVASGCDNGNITCEELSIEEQCWNCDCNNFLDKIAGNPDGIINIEDAISLFRKDQKQ